MSRNALDFNIMIAKEYKAAKEKHTKFCDVLTAAKQDQMALYEHRIKIINSKPPYYGEFILNEEMAEAEC